jgi:hypothetical protein
MEFYVSLPLPRQKEVLDVLYNEGYTTTDSFPESKTSPDWHSIEPLFEDSKATFTAVRTLLYKFIASKKSLSEQPQGNLI